MLQKLIELTRSLIRESGGEEVLVTEDRSKSYTIVSRIENRNVMIKVAEDEQDIDIESKRDTSVFTNTLLMPVIGIVSKIGGVVLTRGIVYEDNYMRIVSLSTFKDFLEGKAPVMVVKHGRVVYKIDPDKFRRARISKGLSLGDVASHLSVSMKTVYRYEHEVVEVNYETYSKLRDLLKEDVAAGQDLFEPVKSRIPGQRIRRCEDGTSYVLSRSHPLSIHVDFNNNVSLVCVGDENCRASEAIASLTGASVEQGEVCGDKG